MMINITIVLCDSSKHSMKSTFYCIYICTGISLYCYLVRIAI